MIRFVLADLRRHRIGAAVIVLLITLAVAIGVGVTLQERALRLGSARAADKFDLIVGAPGSETQLVLSSVFLQPAALPLVPGEILERLAADPRVDWAAPLGFGDFHGDHPVIGTTRTLIAKTTTGFRAGGMFTGPHEAVVGASVALDPGAGFSPVHGKLTEGGHAHDEASYRVVGKLEPTGTAWDLAILVPIRSVWEVHGLGAEHGHSHADDPLDEDWHPGETPPVPAILVKPRTIADAYRLRQEYRADPQTMAVFPGEVLTSLYATLGDAKRVLSIVAGATQALVAAALLLVTIMHVGQRRRQIGALRAFGAPRAAVFGIVWVELFALIATGILLGHALGYVAAKLISRGFTSQNGFGLPVEFAAGDGVRLMSLCVFAVLLSGIPAWLAYRQSPVAALRS
ncbi:MAG TPA: ABC transporter permease [Paracoccus sp. (in: a-proteobacteria)]|uniref:ABC transporter permease n=1 Tax=Paracoccus sp. TaxID=267 RepID=UPI002C20C69D|nr:ABC transporter permease [Paracoccus sp. (in: a-proteobacteria)]HWL57776.1 ABC transporter permease [Paracoccus sp. (in: a-proteobacteria)]